MRVLLVTALVVAAAATENFYRLPAPYAYSCRDSRCNRQERSQATEHQSLETCQLTCGKYGALWPQPTGAVQLSPDTVSFSPRNFRVTKVAVPGQNQRIEDMVHEAVRFFYRNLHYAHPEFPEEEKRPFYSEEENQNPEEFPQEFVDEFGNSEFNQQQEFRQQRHFGSDQFRDFQRRPEQQFLRYSPYMRERSSPRAERHDFDIEFTITSPDTKLSLDTDESYNLVVQTVDDKTTATILATNYFGARHALESLSQLIAFDDDSNSLQVVKNAKIHDEPKFKYRGFMLDTGRNYYAVEDIMQLLDAMSYNKMNYFHWHITDGASFPMYSNRVPEMAYYGAYSPRKVYYPEDIKKIVRYANMRGISVIPELDGPAHTSAGWQWGEKEGKGKLVLCTGEEEPWFSVGKEPPAGQFNPVNPQLYSVLGDIYRDMVDYFDPEMVHMGGDDVSFKCWQNSAEVKEYLAANNRESNSREYFELWNTYQRNAFSKLREATNGRRKVTPIIHSSSFARNYVDKNTYVIALNENSNDTVIADYVKNNFSVIFSNQDQWRLDCAGSSWVGDKAKSCSNEIPTWRHFYENSPRDMLYSLGVTRARNDLPQGQDEASQINPAENVLGGEATLWSSETDGNGFQAKIFPRVSALAERLWTDPQLPVRGVDTVQKRLNTHRQRMVYRGIRADPIQPEYCMHNEDACYTEEQYRSENPRQ